MGGISALVTFAGWGRRPHYGTMYSICSNVFVNGGDDDDDDDDGYDEQQ